MNLEEVKEYLRIDEDADDLAIQIMMDTAKQFITDAVGFYEGSNPKIKMLFALVMQDFYENRVLVVKESDRQRLAFVASSLLMQLQVEALMKEDEENVSE